MKKLTILALVASLSLAATAFGQGRRLVAEPNATFAIGAPGVGAGPATTNNDDSCDIGVAPAATLLLPYFEVDVNAPNTTATTTLFTITNVSPYAQIAHITIWTDWSFPVLDFNVFLTGYDVQAINLWDVLVRGIVAPGTPAGTSATVDEGPLSFDNTANPNINAGLALGATGTCAGLPGQLPDTLVAAVRSALTTGIYNPGFGVSCGTVRVGGTHTNAIGYATIDVANNCSTNFPDNPAYIQGELLFDNVLIGDYQQVSPNPATGNFAGGNPLVHIRAIPEGGPAGQVGVQTNLPYTFYDRYTTVGTGETVDRRQPLPSTFAARYISSGPVAGAFNTDFKIWREGVTFGTQSCASATAATAPVNNSTLPVSDIVRFDERENAFGFGAGQICSPCGPGGIPPLPETSRVSAAGSNFPSLTSGDVAGWMYLDLDNNYRGAGYSSQRDLDPATAGTNRPSQNWVIVSMQAEGRYAVDFDAAWLGNGCSPAEAPAGSTPGAIAPSGGVLVCPAGATCTGTAYTGTNVTP